MSWMVKDFIYDLDHARRYMGSCLFFHNDDVIYVCDVHRSRNNNKIETECIYLHTPDRVEILSLDNISVKEFPLGFVNIPARKTVINVVRSPARIWKYGLHASAISIQNNVINISREAIITSENIGRTIKREFPSLEDAQQLGGCAFHNDYAIQDNNILWRYWEVPIAEFKNEEIEIERPFAFLKEELSEITERLVVPC